MFKRLFSLLLCLVLLGCLVPGLAFAEVDYDEVTIKEGDNVLKLLEANSLSYENEKYVVMVLNRFDRESQMEVLSIGNTIRIPRAPKDIVGSAPHLISNRDQIAYYVIPQSITAGDTLRFIYKLWGLRYDDYAELIKALNPERNLDLLYVGAIYLLPTSVNNVKTEEYTKVMAHTMKKGETAYEVFTSYGIDYYENLGKLKSYNHGNDLTKISAGEKLLIPII